MLDWLQGTSYAAWVRESWGWPFALTFHAFGNAIVIGLTFIIALRLAGLFRTVPYSSLRKLIPVIWTGVIVQVLSGTTLFMTKPARYLGDGMFQWKLIFVASGIIITLYFQKVLNREVNSWEASKGVSQRGLQVIAAMTFAWAGVLVVGRLTAYLGQLYHA